MRGLWKHQRRDKRLKVWSNQTLGIVDKRETMSLSSLSGIEVEGNFENSDGGVCVVFLGHGYPLTSQTGRSVDLKDRG